MRLSCVTNSKDSYKVYLSIIMIYNVELQVLDISIVSERLEITTWCVQLIQVVGTQLEAAYGMRMTGEGPIYRERQKGRVQCGDCGKEVAAGSLASHRVTQHRRAAKEWSIWEASTTRGQPYTYQMALPTKGGPWSCPVEGFPGRARTRMLMQMHFFNRHVWDIMIILEEGNLPHPRCP